MALNPNIILAGQSPDIIGAMDRGRVAAEGQIGLNRQNALAALYQEQGPGIMAGEQSSLNALARFDPMTAQGVQSNILGMESTRLGMDQTRQQMTALDAQTKRQAEEYAKGISAEQAAKEAAELEAGVKQALTAPTPEAFDAMMVQMGRPEMVGQFDNRQQLAAQFMSVAEILKMNAPVEGPEWAAATPEEAARYGAQGGQINRKTGEFKRTPMDKGMIIETMPDGTTRITEGAGVGQGSGALTVGEAYNPNEISSVVNMIDEIAANPNLDGVLGPLEGGGGNNIDDMSDARRLYYGGEGTALIERIGQLQNNAWLSARQMLKGGGAITDYESRKAEGAVARLSRAKSEAEFRTALKDLRDAIVEGEAKLRGGQPAAGGNVTSSGVQWSIVE